MSTEQRYFLNIDGPLFRQQRKILFKLCSDLSNQKLSDKTTAILEALEGLINLTDQIADQAHDRYGIDCLLTEGEEI